MHKLLRRTLLFSFAVALVACSPDGQSQTFDQSKPLDLKFTAVDGRVVDLAKMRGKVVLIDFWATWCAPCRIIAPDILAAYNKYHNQGFEVIGVSVDTDKEALLDVVKKEGLVWPQYYDGKGVDNEITNRFAITTFPTLWLIDKKGMVVSTNLRDVWAVNGGIPYVTPEATIEKFDAELEKLLKAP